MRDFMRNSDLTVNSAIIYNLYDMIAINQLMLDIFFILFICQSILYIYLFMLISLISYILIYLYSQNEY